MGLEWIAIVIAAVIAVTGTRAQIISDKRQQWIDGLRGDVSALMRLMYEHDKNKLEIYEVGSRVELRLNPNEKLHNELLDLLQRIRICANYYKTEADYNNAINDVINKTKEILKAEWDRIKFESTFYWPFISPILPIWERIEKKLKR